MPKWEVVARLQAFGLERFEIDILYARFWDEMSFKEIVRKFGWTSTGSANHLFQTALKKLRERGFSFK